MTPTRSLAVMCLLATLAAPLAGQAADTSVVPPVREAPAIHAWQVGLALGGVALVSLADKSIRTSVLEHRTQTDLDIAKQWQRWGAEGAIGVTAVTLGSGLILGKPGVTRTGERLVASLGAVSVVGWVMKKSISRYRPSETTDPYVFAPFGSHTSFPSGHTFAAFTVSTTLADAIHNRWADIGLYTLAAGTGVSRVVGNHHWASDVVGGALLGTTVAKVVDGKWRIFHLAPPQFLTGPQGAGLRWTADIPALRGGPGAR